MKANVPVLLLFGLAVFAQAPAASAQGVALISISGLLQELSPQLTSIAIPGFGTLGGLSLSSLDSVPGISLINIPQIGQVGSVPVIGSITIINGVQLLESVAPFQIPFIPQLPGLPFP